MSAVCFASRTEAFHAKDLLAEFGIAATVTEYPADDGEEGWVEWEVTLVDDIDTGDHPSARAVLPRLVLASETELDEHDVGRSSLFDDAAEDDIAHAYGRPQRRLDRD